MTDEIVQVAVNESSLAHLRKHAGTWAVYCNAAMDQSDFGRIVFLQYGEGATHATPPPHLPDTGLLGAGWKYRHVGFVEDDSIHTESPSMRRLDGTRILFRVDPDPTPEPPKTRAKAARRKHR